MESITQLTRCPKTYDKWFVVVLGMVFVFMVYAVYIYIHGDPETTQASVISTSQTLVLTANVPSPPSSASQAKSSSTGSSALPGAVGKSLLTGGNPWTAEEDEEEEQSGYKGQPVEIPPKGKYVPPESATSDLFVLTEHTNEEDGYEKPVCKRLEESGERYNETEAVDYGEV